MGIKDNLNLIYAKLASSNADICAVTKNVGFERINEAIACGIRIIGENRAQELCEKYDKINRDDIQIHFIGQLQTNKVKKIIDKIDMIQSVDSVRLAREIDRCAERINRIMPVLLEINTGGEPSKGGIAPDMLFQFAEELQPLKSIKVTGLMTVIPNTGDDMENRKFFTRMKVLFDSFAQKYPGASVLSMGMSEDYARAAECGATVVRLGRAIFGERK